MAALSRADNPIGSIALNSEGGLKELGLGKYCIVFHNILFHNILLYLPPVQERTPLSGLLPLTLRMA